MTPELHRTQKLTGEKFHRGANTRDMRGTGRLGEVSGFRLRLPLAAASS